MKESSQRMGLFVVSIEPLFPASGTDFTSLALLGRLVKHDYEITPIVACCSRPQTGRMAGKQVNNGLGLT